MAQQYKEIKEDRERAAARCAREYERDCRSGLSSTPHYAQSLMTRMRALEYKLDLILGKLEKLK